MSKMKQETMLIAKTLTGAAYTSVVFAGPYALVGHIFSVEVICSVLAAFSCSILSFLLGFALRHRVLRFIIGCTAQVFLMFFIWTATGSWEFAAALLPLALRSLFVCVRYDEAVGGAHTVFCAVGLAACFIVAKVCEWDALFPVFEVIGGVALVFTLLLSNRRSLISARTGVSNKTVGRSNFMFALLVTAGIIVLANIRTIRDSLTALWNAFTSGASWFAAFLAGLLPQSEEIITGDPGAAPGDMSMLLEETTISAENPIITMILNAVVILILVAAGIALLIFLGKQAHKAYLRVRALMREMMADGNYVEEESSLFDWDEVKADFQNVIKRARKRLSRPKSWNRLTNAERVRRAYALFIKKSSKDLSVKTVREALAEAETLADASAFMQSYDNVRYGDMDATDREAENAAKLVN